MTILAEKININNIEISWEEFENDTKNMYDKINNANTQYTVILGIGRGGLIPAVMLSHMFGIPLVPIVWKQETNNAANACILKNLAQEMVDNNNILIIDDISYSGKTMKAVLETLSMWLTAADKKCNITIATVYEKKNPKIKSNFIGRLLNDDDFYVFPWEAD